MVKEFVNEETGEVRPTPFVDEHGREILDSRPMSPPVGYKKQPSLIDHVIETRRQIREELSRAAEEAGFESMADADDFYIDDDPVDPFSPWEQNFEPPVVAWVPKAKEAPADAGGAEAATPEPGKAPPAAAEPPDSSV